MFVRRRLHDELVAAQSLIAIFRAQNAYSLPRILGKHNAEADIPIMPTAANSARSLIGCKSYEGELRGRVWTWWESSFPESVLFYFLQKLAFRLRTVCVFAPYVLIVEQFSWFNFSTLAPFEVLLSILFMCVRVVVSLYFDFLRFIFVYCFHFVLFTWPRYDPIPQVPATFSSFIFYLLWQRSNP